MRPNDIPEFDGDDIEDQGTDKYILLNFVAIALTMHHILMCYNMQACYSLYIQGSNSESAFLTLSRHAIHSHEDYSIATYYFVCISHAVLRLLLHVPSFQTYTTKLMQHTSLFFTHFSLLTHAVNNPVIDLDEDELQDQANSLGTPISDALNDPSFAQVAPSQLVIPGNGGVKTVFSLSLSALLLFVGIAVAL